MRELQDGDFPFGADWTTAARDALTGDCIRSGCAVTINGTGALGTGGGALSIAAGDAVFGGVSQAVAAQNADVAAASAFKRYDLVTVDNTGTVNVATGQTDRVTPTIPAGEVVLAVVGVPTAASGPGDLTVYDSRAVFAAITSALIAADAVGSSEIAANAVGISEIETIAPNQISPQGAGSTLDADTLDGSHAGAFDVHIEAKRTGGGAASESVSWTLSFATSPVVATSCIRVGGTQFISATDSRSTTGATVTSTNTNGTTDLRAKDVIAREAT